MNLKLLYQSINDCGFAVKKIDLHKITAMTIRYRDKNRWEFTIFINENITDADKECEVLEHELNHIMRGQFYEFDVPTHKKQKVEDYTDRPTIIEKCPIEIFKIEFEKKKSELAKKFNVNDDMITKAVRLYRDMDLL